MKDGGDVRIYDFKTKKIVALLTDNALPVNTLAFSPDGKLLPTSNKGKTIRTYSTDNFKLQKTMEGHDREVWNLSFVGNKKNRDLFFRRNSKVMECGEGKRNRFIKITYGYDYQSCSKQGREKNIQFS